ncbi:hypothetical protein GW17_00003158 [Ensete ventricosum]|nr:hypothetical protein GW17_00003158 [Ensete ventricosum]RZS12520.1 hypothetical protein BHM03_00043986 [Ensete ventricosum]
MVLCSFCVKYLEGCLSVNLTFYALIIFLGYSDYLHVEFICSFPALSCEFASVDVSDVLGTNRLNITKTVRKFSIDPNLIPTGAEFHSRPIPKVSKHGDDSEEEYADGSDSLTAEDFEKYAHQYSILVVNFFAPWCYWSNRLKPSWARAAKIIKERYDPKIDGRILLGKVDCTREGELCRRYFPWQRLLLFKLYHVN